MYAWHWHQYVGAGILIACGAACAWVLGRHLRKALQAVGHSVEHKIARALGPVPQAVAMGAADGHRAVARAGAEGASERVLIPADGWHAIGGDRLELRDTGFAIELVRKKNTPPYWLIDPEGNTLGWQLDLAVLKRTAEALAGDRAQFGAGLARLNDANGELAKAIARIARKHGL